MPKCLEYPSVQMAFEYPSALGAWIPKCPNALSARVPLECPWSALGVPLECPWSAFGVPNFPSSSAGVPKFPLKALLVKMSVTLQEMDSLIVLWGF